MEKDVKGNSLLPEGVTVGKLKTYIQEAEREYNRPLRRMRVLDGADKGRLWEVVKAKFPAYQILPDTNHMNFIKENLVASIYATGQYAELTPKSKDDMQFVVEFNAALSTIWEQVQAKSYQQQAGLKAALLNIGITQVGWRKDVLGGTDGHWYRGDVVFKNIDPMKFRRDPYAVDLDSSRYCYYTEEYSEAFIKTNKNYRERLDLITKFNGGTLSVANETPATVEAVTERAHKTTSDEYHTVTCMWLMLSDNSKEGFRICEVHLLDNEYVLYVKDNLKPKMFPFAILYCNDPEGDLVGVSPAARQFANSLAYNMLGSIQATAAYKAQRPPKFINTQSGINIRQFAAKGNDADATFLVNGDATQAVHYGIFPTLPIELDKSRSTLAFDIKDISGVDDRYTGRDTGSIQGTGAMDSMLTKVTGTDLMKIELYSLYTKRLSELVVNNLVHFGDKREYTVKDPISQKTESITIDFLKISDDTRFGYTLDIQTSLPRNKARNAAVANMLLEKQTQYRPNPEIITVEEWLLMQDIPFKDLIFKRMGIQRNTVFTEQVAKTLTMFADMVEQGADPGDAVDMIAESMQNEQVPNQLGNVAAGSPQAAQQGMELPQEEGMPMM